LKIPEVINFNRTKRPSKRASHEGVTEKVLEALDPETQLALKVL
jgi:hypothetical protein